MSSTSTDMNASMGKAKVIAIASGKGGVGKSTVTANLALALKNRGKKVGIIDADIYGPSQVMLLGGKGLQHSVQDDKIIPIEKHGIPFVSMASLMAEDGPVIWRAPMAIKVIQQFLLYVEWGELDYILIDLPPGTGDVQLTLAQQTQLSGAVIVTTPQQVAVGVARKGLQMFQEVGVPIFGVIENMQGFVCENCHHTNHIFSSGGGEALASQFHTEYLGGIPLCTSIARSGDLGIPVVIGTPEGKVSESFATVAKNLEHAVTTLIQKEDRPIVCELTNGGARLVLEWADGVKGELEARALRFDCPCALCVNEDNGVRLVRLENIPLTIRLQGKDAVGRYGTSLHFSDQHKTGIYRFEFLKEMVQKRQTAEIGPQEFDV